MIATIEQPLNRVRRHTAQKTSEAIKAKTRENVRTHSLFTSREMGRRIAELDREWDVERTLEANASTLALTGAVLGATVNKKWFWLTGVVLGFLTQHAMSGWCPPLPFLRKLGVRTRDEIDQEKFALKAIRGDFAWNSHARLSPDAVLSRVNAREDGDDGREPDRIRRYTGGERLRRIDAVTTDRVRAFSNQSPEAISRRIAELQREWSIERYLQLNVAAVGLTTAALAVTKNPKWGYVTCAGLALFLFHAVEGFDLPLPLLRRRGVRSREEIDREIYALRVLRGDFDDIRGDNNPVEAAIAAVGI
jgi:hypothetical protein